MKFHNFALLLLICAAISSIIYTTGCRKPEGSALTEMQDALNKMDDQKSFQFIVIKSKIGNTPVANAVLDSHYTFDKAFKRLHEAPHSQDKIIISWIKNNADSLPTPLLYELSDRLYNSRPNESRIWRTIGYIRSFYDLKRCQDANASFGRFYMLDNFKRDNEYWHNHPEIHTKIWEGALAWENHHENFNSPLWMCTAGAINFKFDKGKLKPFAYEDLVKPESEWPTLRKQTMEKIEKDIRAELKKESQTK